VCYVWFDALINYVSATGYLQEGADYERWWPATCHLIGKDILTTHCVYWPTMLKAAGLAVPETVLAHGWWMVEAEKMSKSRGNVIRPLDLAEKYGVDAFRYFLTREMVLGLDSSFSETAFVARYNAELANDLGNLLNRSVVMAQRYLDGVVPDVDRAHEALRPLRKQAARTLEQVSACLADLNPNGTLEATWGLVREANRFAEVQAPWHLAKDPDRREELEVTVYGLLETMRQLAVLMFPVMPRKAADIWRQLGCPEAIDAARLEDLDPWGQMKPGLRVQPGAPVFPRIEAPALDEPTEKPTDTDSKEHGMPQDETETIPFDTFQKIQLRVARIRAAERVAGADRLLKLQVSLGDEQRQLVAGVAQHYTPEDLVGRQIVVVANLQPATIRGVESQGMLLAASDGDTLALLGPDAEVPDGTGVR
jgi:methionyl-tRNA synthetase